jgi:hypothetical protein
MERKIDIDLIIWLVFFLLLFGGSLAKWLIRRFSRKEEATPQEKPLTFMEEFKKMLEGMVLEGRPEIVIVGERPPKKRLKHVKAKAPKEVPSEVKPVLRPTPEQVETKEAIRVVRPPGVPLSEILPKDELQRAIVMSEILGPPRAKRRHYRLF